MRESSALRDGLHCPFVRPQQYKTGSIVLPCQRRRAKSRVYRDNDDPIKQVGTKTLCVLFGKIKMTTWRNFCGRRKAKSDDSKSRLPPEHEHELSLRPYVNHSQTRQVFLVSGRLWPLIWNDARFTRHDADPAMVFVMVLGTCQLIIGWQKKNNTLNGRFNGLDVRFPFLIDLRNVFHLGQGTRNGHHTATWLCYMKCESGCKS